MAALTRFEPSSRRNPREALQSAGTAPLVSERARGSHKCRFSKRRHPFLTFFSEPFPPGRAGFLRTFPLPRPPPLSIRADVPGPPRGWQAERPPPITHRGLAPDRAQTPGPRSVENGWSPIGRHRLAPDPENDWSTIAPKLTPPAAHTVRYVNRPGRTAMLTAHTVPRLRCHFWLFAEDSQDGGISEALDLERILKLCTRNSRSEAQPPGRCSQKTLGRPARPEHADATSFDCGSGCRGFDPRHSPQHTSQTQQNH